MADTPTIADRNLEATTHISLKREPACFGFLSTRSIAVPIPIDSIHLDLTSADYFQGRASLWTSLELRSSVKADRAMPLIGFDETFLAPFARALVEASTTRTAYRMSVAPAEPSRRLCRVVEYVTGAGEPLEELILQPHENVVQIISVGLDGEETLFQLPRTDAFLRAFARMAYLADQALSELLDEMRRLARGRAPA